MPKLWNTAIAGNWENWVRVFLMAIIAFVVLDCSFALFHGRKDK